MEQDLRAGGAAVVMMRSPEGQEFPNPGTHLEVVPNRKLVFTDAFRPGFSRAGEPFMVAEVRFEDEGGKTRYVAKARHWNAEAKAKGQA